jgi:hypothetical protein
VSSIEEHLVDEAGDYRGMADGHATSGRPNASAWCAERHQALEAGAKAVALLRRIIAAQVLTRHGGALEAEARAIVGDPC